MIDFFVSLCTFKRAQFSVSEDGIAIGPNQDNLKVIVSLEDFRPVHPIPYGISLIAVLRSDLE